jgi:CheY-like chemotaxis protein
MKKVVVAKGLNTLFTQKSILDRGDIKVFTADSNDNLLKICMKEAVDLVVTQLEMPGIRIEDVFATIKKSRELSKASTILVCTDTLAHRERCKQCNANAVFTVPVDTALLHMKIEQFLNVAPRKSYRAMIAVAIAGRFKNHPLPFWTENISASGMLIRTEEPLSAGEGIFFSFFLSDGAHVSGYGEIVRTVEVSSGPRSFLYGIKYTDIDQSARAAIEKATGKK